MIKKIIKNNILLICIVAFALFIRLYGLYPGYPDNHPDESSSYSTAVHIIYNFLKPDRFDYPAGMSFVNALAYLIFFVPFAVFKIVIFNIDALFQLILSPHNFFVQHKEIIFGNRDVYAMYWTRAVTAFFGAGTVLMLYFTGKKLFNKEVGLFSAFFLSVNYLHVVRSHFGLPDIYNGFYITMTIFACALLLEKPTRKRYLLATFGAGLMFATKYQIFAFVPIVVTVIFIAIKKRNFLYLFNKDFIMSIFFSVGLFIFINPYYLFNIQNAMSQNGNDVRRYQMGLILFRPYAYHYLFHWGIGNLPSIAIIVGIIFMALKKTKKFLLISSFVFAIFFFMTIFSQGGMFTRNFANVMPLLMLYAGFSFSLLFTYLRRFGKQTALVISLFIIILVNIEPIKNSVVLSHSYAQRWNADELSDWLDEKMPKNVTILHYQSFFPIKAMNAFQSKHTVLKDWDYSKGPNSLAEFQEIEADLALLNTNPLQSITYWWRGYSELYLGSNKVPFYFIENGFYGLSIKELSRYTIFEAYKPWQSHYENNYVVYKIPQKPKEFGKKLKEYTFSSKKEMWEKRGNFLGQEPIRSAWFEQGKDNKGSMVATSSGSPSRLASEPISVKKGKLYSVKGWIKTVSSSDGERDGFFRIDFYKDKSFEKIGEAVAISPRAFATGEWSEQRVSLVAPINAQYMTVSFQFNNAYFSSIVDDVSIFETDIIPEETLKEIPYIPSTIPLESMYYNTFI